MQCRRCKKEFIVSHPTKIYCSLKCRNYQHIIKFQRNCIYCNKDFIGRKTQKFCSQNCSASSRVDHLNKIHIAKRKYPKIEGLNRCQIFRRFNPDKGREELHRDNIKRVIVIQFLGGQCCKCGYSEDIRALQLDHINGDGHKDRKTKGKLGKIYRYYTNNLEEARKILQVLCANCHAIKSISNRDYDCKRAKEFKASIH